jgi:hypothetical protein
MNVKALLICEDVRVEVGSTLTLVGVFNDRIVVDSIRDTSPAIEMPRLALEAVIAGLRGIERVAYRLRTRRFEDPDPEPLPFAFEPHAPEADEHNFVLVQSPMVFPNAGDYEVVLEVDAGGQLLGSRYRFRVERR